MAPSTQPEPIAIIGSACRFPGGASSPSKLWELLRSPRDLLSPISCDRFDPSGFYHPDGEHHGGTNVQSSYQLQEDTRVFDASFFSINAREAEAMDPQHRVLLETVYECMENAGATIQHLEASQTGVYVGLMTNDYHDVHLRDMETIPKYSGTGTTRSILSNRVSYFFNWKGPSMTIDTACSSSLVAVHLAVQSLRSGETPVAVAAGANLIFGPEMYIIESKLSMLSPHGRSRMWDHNADGYGRGEGVAAVMLKTLSHAIRDGDPIECIIRETGVNQDGRTPGITMPSPRSQEALIRDTYCRAGLDLANKEDRPQFFEAHGTGTPVGDPLEAEAISNAFFGHENAAQSTHDVLYVGGIKTVIGHLEGAAGIASLLKTSLALQNGTIPPNMHLDQLNPKLAAFTANLRVPAKAIQWPTSSSAVRRASVNSFGFGGTNAHAILESFDDTRSRSVVAQQPCIQLSPFVFSANSQTSLLAMVTRFAHHLSNASCDTNMRDLAWTLQTKRTELPCRKAFSAPNLQSLVRSMQEAVQMVEDTPSAVLGTQIASGSKRDAAKILGIFTGQGAQWPRMGAELLSSSHVFASTIKELQASLDDLPDGPSWRIKDELEMAGAESRVHLAEVSQPLCTAVQIALVDMLSNIGVCLSAVVGHSSGEIGAAYSAGIISARDAIRIAYYRGVYAEQASGGGSMMAVGVSFAQAQTLCEQERFAGRIVVAASNAPSTVTISGDEDAINELKMELDEQKTFARLLRVNKAYHSHHMVPCSAPYLAALDKCGIQAQPPGAVHWISTVDPSLDTAATSIHKSIAGSYWVDNMANPVLFSQAVGKAVADYGSFDLAIEIGPHAALKGPTTQTIKGVQNATIPYHGTLERGVNDSVAFSAALGFMWERLAVSGCQLGHFTTTLVGDEEATKPAFNRSLPNYPWDHGQQYWKESRLSKNFRCPKQPVHQLLGKQCSDNVETHDLRWRNILKVEEMPWLRGHKFQNEILFPAAGHVALAIEAGKVLAGDHSVSLIELENVSVGKAITLEESGPGVEIVFCLKRVESTPSRIVADFACYACPNEIKGVMDQCSAGQIVLHLGDAASDALPGQPKGRPDLIDVDSKDFYESMVEIGLEYTDMFRNMANIRRTRRYATSCTEKPLANAQYASEPMVHPVLLDICFQTVIAAFCFPGDGSFWTPYLPTNINRIRLSPFACTNKQSRRIEIEAQIVEESSLSIIGDLSAYNSLGQQQIQLEGLTCTSFSKALPATDKLLFSETIWRPAISLPEDAHTGVQDVRKDDPADLEAAEINERVAYYYLRTLREKFTQTQIATFEWWFQRLFEFADHLLPMVASGAHPSIRAQWASDTYETIRSLVNKFPDQIDLQLVVEVGENLPTHVQGTVPLLEVMMQEDRLTRLYQTGLGVPEVNHDLSEVAKSLCHQHPDMKILEIGAGTGGMTREVLTRINGAFKSYTFTDISSGYFEKSSERLQVEGKQKIIFSVLDVEKDPASQGYACGTYDMIIASNVLHATRFLGDTLANVRRLLRPGGYLLLNEVTGDMLRLKFIMSGLPGWWLGGDDGRRYAPTITPLQWDEKLREAGFSGVDILKQDYNDPSKHSLSVIVSQAMDEMVEFLREPLAAPYMAPEVADLYIVGGRSLKVRQLARSIKGQLNCWVQDAVMVNDLLELEAADPPEGFTVVCLDDLDEPVMQNLTAEKLRALQRMFGSAKNILYLTRGAWASSPYSMAFTGLARTMLFEHPGLRMQLIDISDFSDVSPRIVAEDLLRLVAGETLDSSYLWTVEPEIAYSRSCKQIQRLVSNKNLNDKLNSTRRLIQEDINTKDFQVTVVRNTEGLFALRKAKPTRILVRDAPADHITLRTLLSLTTPVNFSGTVGIYLSFGVEEGSDTLFAALSSDIASTISVSRGAVVEVHDRGANLEGDLRAIAVQVMVSHILSSAHAGGCIILHEPDEELAQAITDAGTDSKTHIMVTTSDSLRQGVRPWSYIHPYESKSRFEALLPSGVDLFIDFPADQGSLSGKLGERIAASMPASCSIVKVAQLGAENASDLQVKTSQTRGALMAHLRSACLQQAPIKAYSGITTRVKNLTMNEHRDAHASVRILRLFTVGFLLTDSKTGPAFHLRLEVNIRCHCTDTADELRGRILAQ
ncbi:Polyketide synthase [Tolypocladium capitatum]|uniref:Polyketide synthase n=1 Tax=Tolypocladium capitatum TaxID=45235 RepID=A0A2K3QDH6_9HYPO|nr:Polyketide synthase [Tolypocladium capitatum]